MKKSAFFLLVLIAIAASTYYFIGEKTKTSFPEKIIICGVCKNVAAALPQTIASIEKIGERFVDYRVFIYENNSSDDTPALLLDWMLKNPHVSVISEEISQEDLSTMTHAHTHDFLPFRTEIIARARNIVLDQAMRREFDDYKYLLMADMDFSKKWDIEGIMSSFQKKRPWDAICANGIDKKGYLYDRYAFRDERFPLGPELIGEEWWKQIATHPLRLKSTDPLVSVYSAFGGLAIYKRAAIKGCRYSGTVTADLETLLKKIMEKDPLKNHPQILTYLNKEDTDLQIVRIRNKPEALKWILNSGGFGFPVCCEHVTFHASMILKGHDRIYINPQMVMKYR